MVVRRVTEEQVDRVAEVLERQAQVRYKQVQVRLIDLDHKSRRHDFCHRSSEALACGDDDGDNMKALVESMVLEGQQVPVEFYRDPESGTAIVLRGYRRIESLWIAIERKLDQENFHPDMLVSAVEVESDKGYADYLVRSVCDNELRIGLTDDEKLVAAEKMLKAGVSSSRAAKALGMSATHFSRYLRRIGSPAAREDIAKEHITATDADRLLEAAGSVGRVRELEEDLDRVVATIASHIALARAEAVKNQETFDEKKHGRVSKYIRPDQLKRWVEDIKEGRRLVWDPPSDGEGSFSFVCKFGPREGKIKIQALSLDLHRAKYEDVGQLAAKLTRAAEQVTGFFLKKKVERDLWKDTPAEQEQGLIEFFKKHGADNLAAELERKAAAARGEADPDHGKVEPRAERPIAQDIQVPPEPVAPDEEAEFDPMIDGGPAAGPEDGGPAAGPEDDGPAVQSKDDGPAARPEDDGPATEPKDDGPATEPKDDGPAVEPKRRKGRRTR
jgi:hypothetical protein